MNFLSCVLNHVSQNLRVITIYSMIILITDYNMMCNCTMQIRKVEKRNLQNFNLEAEKTHHCKHIGDFALIADCELWSCWESQLRDRTRIKFLDIYNRFRMNIVQQKCKSCQYNDDIPAMMQLEWHWKLEEESQKAIKYCPYQDFRKNLKIHLDDDLSGETNSLQCEMAITSFPIHIGSQNELTHMLPSLLYDNYLHDFNKDNEFRRNLALFIGCSYIPRILNSGQMYSTNQKLKESVGHLSCYYCSKEKAIHSKVSEVAVKCPIYATRIETNEYPLLCKLMNNEITLPCESTVIPCPSWKKSYSWMFPYFSHIVAQLDNGTNLLKEDYVKNFNFNLVSKFDSDIRMPPPVRITITPYIFHIDSLDKKFCFLMKLIYIFIILLMLCAILLIYRFHLVEVEISKSTRAAEQ